MNKKSTKKSVNMPTAMWNPENRAVTTREAEKDDLSLPKEKN